MRVKEKEFIVNELQCCIRSAAIADAKSLSEVRLQVDGETENLDREPGEAYIDEAGFKRIIEEDAASSRNLFLVAEADGRIVGFSRCEGNSLKRTAHQVEFGVGVLKAYWGYGIGKNLLKESIDWAEANHVRKMTLKVLETNKKAILLYEKCGFEVEGILKEDKLLKDGKYYNTVLMGRIG
ncbi:GNAT family N-acetyltransferase [Planomicrobium sp. Y74]|uniref:GNAT family N-acetyltransferase n=1 Tax=Planomicrobium sp. Y74 TaxID=2478977 RepID=UPI000EF44FB3|nr:GNAT family N-acetyltransferase [Planomicrobium sp. Y74]RLQ89894.1 GNAT family N-acetyltransferase [Planomicrobium sp. Y74]